MMGFILLLFIFISGWIALMAMDDVQEIKKNWPAYRCRPSVIPFASLYGYDAAENFTFCISNMMNLEMGSALGPVFTILRSLVTSLITLIAVANSLRLQFATMMGGVNTIFQNFADRFRQLTSAIQMSAYRMKLLMGRVYGAFFAMIYMSISGMTAMQNFTETGLFRFLDTFCFDPETPVEIQGKGMIPIKEASIGDRFVQTGGTITSTFSFAADGQPMVELPGGILVSTNHYVQFNETWIQAANHPLAKPMGPWTGGAKKPLICFNTSDHTIPIGSFRFLDYDETSDGDQQTMNWVDEKLNGKPQRQTRAFDYTTCVAQTTRIRMLDGSVKPISEIRLGDRLRTGKVVGVVKKHCKSLCTLDSGEIVSPGLAYWHKTQWVRAGDLHRQEVQETPIVGMSLVVLGTASFETDKGSVFRDYVEVHSPDSEHLYAEEIQKLNRKARTEDMEALPVY